MEQIGGVLTQSEVDIFVRRGHQHTKKMGMNVLNFVEYIVIHHQNVNFKIEIENDFFVFAKRAKQTKR